MKKFEIILKKVFPEAEILKDIRREFYFVKPAICDEQQEKIIKQNYPNVNIVNAKGADGENTIFLFE